MLWQTCDDPQTLDHMRPTKHPEITQLAELSIARQRSNADHGLQPGKLQITPAVHCPLPPSKCKEFWLAAGHKHSAKFVSSRVLNIFLPKPVVQDSTGAARGSISQLWCLRRSSNGEERIDLLGSASQNHIYIASATTAQRSECN
jgi:hypothetical protein